MTFNMTQFGITHRAGETMNPNPDTIQGFISKDQAGTLQPGDCVIMVASESCELPVYRKAALGEVAEAFLTGAAAAGITKLGGEIEQINTLVAAHGEPAVLDALRRAVAFRRWRAGDVVSILAAGNGVPSPRAAGEALILDLPVAPTRSLDAYRIGGTR